MPTGSEFSRVDLGGGSSSQGNSTGNWTQQGEGPLNEGVGAGNYPRPFDTVAGSESTSASYYPESVFSGIPASGPQHPQGTGGGEYGQSDGITNPIYPGTNMVPSPTPSKQFSSDKTGDPRALLEQTREDVMRHADMNAAFGLMQPVSTLSHTPWLRDGLATPGENEPGNAEPNTNIKVPKRKGA